MDLDITSIYRNMQKHKIMKASRGVVLNEEISNELSEVSTVVSDFVVLMIEKIEILSNKGVTKHEILKTITESFKKIGLNNRDGGLVANSLMVKMK